MPAEAIVLVLVSSVFHVAWNSLVKTSDDPLATATRAVGIGVLALTPFVGLAWLALGQPGLPAEAWGIALVSGIVSAAYFVPLSAAYRHGALSSVYPVARGSGALLNAVVGIVVLGERLDPLGYVGVALLLAGTLGAAAVAASRKTVVPALLAGCAIVGYSSLDRVGVRMGDAWLYAWGVWTVCAIGLVAWRRLTARAWRTARPGSAPSVPGPAPSDQGSIASDPGATAPAAAFDGPGPTFASPPRGLASAVARVVRAPDFRRSLAAGLLIIGTYYLILLAFQVAALAAVAPLREATTILAAAWGVIALGERDRAGIRLAAATAVGIGAVMLAISG